MKPGEKEIVISVIRELKLACHANAKEHGFWEEEDEFISILDNYYELSNRYTDINEHKARIISLFNSEKIALEMSELAERLETLRKDPAKQDEHCPEFLSIEIEVADLIIRALDFCGRRRLNIEEALIAKMEYNSTREYKHGKRF